MIKLTKKLFTALTIIFGLMGMIGSLAVHVYTILIAYKLSGFMAAITSFCFPVGSQIYWFIHIWSETGQFINRFSFPVLQLLGIYVLFALSAGAGVWLEKKNPG